LEADNIVLDGFTVGSITPTGPIPAAAISTSAAFSGYQIRNNLVDWYAVGLSLGSSGANQTIVSGNITGINANGALSNLLVENNHLSGITLAGTAVPLTDITIANNTFTQGGNLQLANVTDSTISANEFTGSLGTNPFLYDPSGNVYQAPPLPTITGIILAG